MAHLVMPESPFFERLSTSALIKQKIRIMLLTYFFKRCSRYYYTENPQNASNEIIEQLERIFAYELYHQWSILQEDYNRRVPEDYKRIINGEIGKQLLGVNKYPDMVLHKGHGDIHNQEIVIEIKRKAELKDDNAIQDLINPTLTL